MSAGRLIDNSAEAMFAISIMARVISGHDVVALPEPVEGCDSPPDPRQVRIFAATLAEALEYTGALYRQRRGDGGGAARAVRRFTASGFLARSNPGWRWA